MRGEITYQFSKFTGCTFEVWEWICSFTPHFIMDVIIYPRWEQNLSMLLDNFLCWSQCWYLRLPHSGSVRHFALQSQVTICSRRSLCPAQYHGSVLTYTDLSIRRKFDHSWNKIYICTKMLWKHPWYDGNFPCFRIYNPFTAEAGISHGEFCCIFLFNSWPGCKKAWISRAWMYQGNL